MYKHNAIHYFNWQHISLEISLFVLLCECCVCYHSDKLADNEGCGFTCIALGLMG